MKVKTKAENYRLYDAGVFGNKMRSWNSIDEVRQSDYPGTVGMRYKVRNVGFCTYNLTLDEAEVTLADWVSKGVDGKLISYVEYSPEYLLLLQGELMLSDRGWYLHYSREKAPMREALSKQSYDAYGLAAIDLLRRTLTLPSYEDVMLLFEIFPDSIVEFSTFSRNLGILPRRNTIIWEVRNY